MELGIQFVAGKVNRLTIDSTAPSVNPHVQIQEKVFSPTTADVEAVLDDQIAGVVDSSCSVLCSESADNGYPSCAVSAGVHFL